MRAFWLSHQFEFRCAFASHILVVTQEEGQNVGFVEAVARLRRDGGFGAFSFEGCKDFRPEFSAPFDQPVSAQLRSGLKDADD